MELREKPVQVWGERIWLQELTWSKTAAFCSFRIKSGLKLHPPSFLGMPSLQPHLLTSSPLDLAQRLELNPAPWGRHSRPSAHALPPMNPLFKPLVSLEKGPATQLPPRQTKACNSVLKVGTQELRAHLVPVSYQRSGAARAWTWVPALTQGQHSTLCLLPSASPSVYSYLSSFLTSPSPLFILLPLLFSLLLTLRYLPPPTHPPRSLTLHLREAIFKPLLVGLNQPLEAGQEKQEAKHRYTSTSHSAIWKRELSWGEDDRKRKDKKLFGGTCTTVQFSLNEGMWRSVVEHKTKGKI